MASQHLCLDVCCVIGNPNSKDLYLMILPPLSMPTHAPSLIFTLVNGTNHSPSFFSQKPT